LLRAEWLAVFFLNDAFGVGCEVLFLSLGARDTKATLTAPSRFQSDKALNYKASCISQMALALLFVFVFPLIGIWVLSHELGTTSKSSFSC